MNHFLLHSYIQGIHESVDGNMTKRSVVTPATLFGVYAWWLSFMHKFQI